jgi:hypothetical protein
MKKQDWLINTGIVIVLVAVIIVVTVKYIIPKPNNAASNPGSVSIKEIDKIKLSDLNGNEMPLNILLNKGLTYCLIFDLGGCYSCIYRGVEDLKKLQANGQNCFAVLVHDRLDEAQGWSSTQDFTPFYVLKKADFYQYINTPMIPVLIKIENNQVNGYTFIKP